MPDKPEPLIVAEPENLMPKGRRFWVDNEMLSVDKKSGLPVPHYSIKETAKVFFGKGPDWLRWRLRADPAKGKPEGYFILDGEPLDIGRTEAGARIFTLADIERMATALAQQGLIDGVELNLIVLLVKIEAMIHGVGV